MNIPGISATDFAAGTQSSFPTQELDKDAFMRLLVSQLENQDPLEPLKNEEFVAQLATFSSLEQLELVNEGLLTMLAFDQANALLSQITQGSSLIGKEVRWTDPATGATKDGVVDSVKVANGYAALTIDGEDVPLGYLTEVLGDGESTGDSTAGA